MRVLIVKTSSMGDVIHTLPALTDAQRALPQATFDWVVEEAFAEIPRWHPAVDQVVPVAIRRWRKTPMKTLRTPEWRQFRADLAKYHYDYIIDAQGLIKSAWITRCAHGPSYGLDRQSVREPLAALMYQHTVAVPKEMHAVERVRQLFAKVLGYEKPGTVGEYGVDCQRFTPASESPEPYLVCLHGTTREDKHWPEPYWRQLIETATAAGYRVKLPWGNDEEKARAQRLCAGLASAEVLPRLNLTSLAAVLAQAKGVVAVDTGLGHLSAALAVPCVSLYGSTSPKLVGAYGAHQTHLVAADYPAKNDARVEPALFAPLTPEVVWQALGETLM